MKKTVIKVPHGIKKNAKAFLVLLACLASLSWGCWNLPVPRADEITYILSAERIVTGEAFSTNTFFLFYAGLLSFVSPDPMLAHLAARLFTSLLSTFGLYFTLRGFRPWLSENSILISVVIWTSSFLCFPFVQLGTISLFGVSLAMCGVGFLLRGFTLHNFLLCEVLVFAGAQSRKELWLPMVLFAIWFVGKLAVDKNLRRGLCGELRSPMVAGLLVVLTMLVALFAVRKAETLGNPQAHLLLGLGQSYAAFLSRTGAAQDFDAMTEYARTLNATFHNPQTVSEAFKNEPREFARFLLMNSLNNLSRLPGCIFSTRDTGAASSVWIRSNAIAMFAALTLGTLIGAVACGRAIATGAKLRKARRQDADLKLPIPQAIASKTAAPRLLEKILVLMVLGSASSVAFLMITYVPRYYLPLVPLAYLYLAWCWQNLLATKIGGAFPEVAIIAVVAFLFCRPGIAPTTDWNADLRALRDARSSLPGQPLVAGIHAEAFSVFGLDGQGKPVVIPGLNAGDLLSGKYDVFIVNGNLRGTSEWAEHLADFDAFLSDPARWGYYLLKDIRNGSCLIFLKVNSHSS